MPIEQLLTKMRPPLPEPVPELQPSARLRELIDRAKRRPPERLGFTLQVDDATAEIEFVEINGRLWCDLTAVNPPREGSDRDAEIGYNATAVTVAYPVQSEWLDGQTIPTILADGEPVTAEQWAEFAGYLDAAALEDAATCLWAIHDLAPRQRHAAALALAKETTND